ncbi:MAG: polysaccharide biosynthesis/export family protein [Pseudomonadota bacterium]|nr:polysaccharide biosynthesis/export family protein [Pseudomonadota bacterium]
MKKFYFLIILLTAFLSGAAQAISLQAVGIDNVGDEEAEKELKAKLTKRIFGANLFTGTVTTDSKTSISPDYVIGIGDQVNFNMWGAITEQSTLTVDNNGNIFIPEVGPVRIADLRLSELEGFVKKKVGQTYKNNVHVYVNLVTSNPVNIFVSGFVNQPGQFSGEQTDSIIQFIHKAGGIDLARGSYRDISVVNAKTGSTKKVDLYPFLLKGKLPEILLHDNDTIVVGSRSGVVQVDGKAQNNYLFEIENKTISGEELLSYARPYPTTSHASINGIRDGESYYVYIPLDEFKSKTIYPNDIVAFQTDVQAQIIEVSVSGENLGASQYAVRKGATLFDVLARVPVNPDSAQLGQVFVKRKSVAKTQKEVIIASLEQLQKKLLASSSLTDRQEQAKVKKIEEINNALEKAKDIKPLGIVVVSKDDDVKNIILEEGDEIVIPSKTDIINIGGEVYVPQAMVYNPEYQLRDYIDSAGGLTDAADSSGILIIHPNGDVSNGDVTTLYPGVKIIVLPEIPTNYLQLAVDLSRIFFNMAVATRATIDVFDDK